MTVNYFVYRFLSCSLIVYAGYDLSFDSRHRMHFEWYAEDIDVSWKLSHWFQGLEGILNDN